MKRRKLEPIIVETSLKLFMENGYDTVSVMDICEACDITKPTFYKYAASKGDLLRFYFNRIPSTLDEDWDNPAVTGSEWESIKGGLTSFLDHFMEYGLDLCTQLYIQNIQTSQDTFEIPDEFQDQLEDLILKAQHKGQVLNSSSAHELVRLSIALLLGYCGYWILFNGQKDAKAEFTKALEMLFQYNPNQMESLS